MRGEFLVVCDQDERCAAFLVKLEQQIDHGGAGARIEIAGGLVGEQQPGFGDESARNGHALLLAAGERPGVMAKMLSQADARQDRARPVGGIVGARQFQRQHDVFLRRERGQ